MLVRRLMLCLVVLAVLAVRTPPTLSERIDDILADERLSQAFWGIYVEDINTGEVLYARNAQKGLIPASNQKILTTATALDVLGSDFRYATTLYFDGTTTDTQLTGDLIIQGAGDPSFGSLEVRGADPFRQWASQLADMGVTHIEGRLIGDDNVFDDAPYADGWDISYIGTESFAPPVSGLTYHDNTVIVEMKSIQVGQAAQVTADPGGYLDVDNRITTHARRRGQAVDVDRPFGTERLRLTGSVHPLYHGSIRIPVHNPTLFALHGFKTALEAAGITVTATLHDVDDLDTRLSYSEADPLLVHFSQPLYTILQEINKDSNNLFAEQLFRTMATDGSTRGGEKRVERLLTRAGVNPYGLSIQDGSGLSRKDIITPQAMGRALAYMHTHPEAAVFKGSLARGGERSTTLQRRLYNVPMRGKTGSLQHVRSLSGYVMAPDDRPLAFVLIVNNYTVASYRITRAIDAIVRELATTAVPPSNS